MGALDYLHLQLRLEGKEIVNGCQIRQVEVVPDEPVPLLLIAQLAEGGQAMYYGETIAPDLYKELAARQIEFPNIDTVINALQINNILFEVGHYKTYVFPSQAMQSADVECLPTHDPRVNAFGFDGFAAEAYVIEQEGQVVSACVSTRDNQKCGEAWVYTTPEYRHQGFAQKVVNAWAQSLKDAGKVPLYSHKIENDDSASLARKLGLRPVFEEISITKTF